MNDWRALFMPESWEAWMVGAAAAIAIAACLGAYLFLTIRARKADEREDAKWKRKAEEAHERERRRYTWDQFMRDVEDPAMSIDELCERCVAAGYVPKKPPPPQACALGPIGPGASVGSVGAHAGPGSLPVSCIGLASGSLVASYLFPDRR